MNRNNVIRVEIAKFFGLAALGYECGNWKGCLLVSVCYLIGFTCPLFDKANSDPKDKSY